MVGLANGIENLEKIQIWGGLGTARHVLVNVEKPFFENVESAISTAVAKRRQRIKYSNAKALLRLISSRGIHVEAERDPDPNDIKGLVGEIIASELLVRTDREPIFTKWEYGGTSKSRGIDVLGREKGKLDSSLILVEAKHLHEEVRSSSQTSCCNSIRGRLVEGLLEFEETKVRLNLAGILTKLQQALSIADATDSNRGRVEEIFNYLLKKLEEGNFDLNVLACLDSKYCFLGMLTETVSSIANDDGSGDHFVELSILQVPSLEEKTDEWCNNLGSTSD